MSQFNNPMQDNTSANSTLESDILMADTQRKENHKRLFKRGCQWMGIGVMILGLSFGITFALFQTDKSFLVIMYVLTSIGAACTIKGLVDILG